jgi:beta-lactamase superfamily II metal-dependent hydrolase
MSIVKSLSVGNGDMFYIRHNSDNFTMIDCSLPEHRLQEIIDELKLESSDKGITRFISTHPDDDHIDGLCELDEAMDLLNFYCVKNATTKPDWTADFERYGELRDDPKKAFHIYKGCSRKWMNQSDEERGSAGINILWPKTSSAAYQRELLTTELGGSPNNISTIIKYSLEDGADILWMGDLETDFMEEVKNEITLPQVDILFAPHHGRDTPPKEWLDAMDPGVVIIGEGPSEDLDPYIGYNKLRQNLAGDITFDSLQSKTHVFVSSYTYSVDFLSNEAVADIPGGRYIGTLYGG